MNRTFPAVSVRAMAAASVLLAACSQAPTPPPVVKPVYVTTVTEAASSLTRSFTAVVRARVETDLGFRAGGKVVDRLVEVGDIVKVGQALADVQLYKALGGGLASAQAGANTTPLAARTPQ